MASGGSSSIERVADALRASGIDSEVQELPQSTRTAVEAAAAVGCAVGQIAKSLVFHTAGGERPILVIASGTNRVDERRLAALVGEPVTKASADYVRRVTGFAIGGVAPVGHATPLTTYIDQDLPRYDTIWAAAGTPRAVVRLTPTQLLALTGGEVIAVTEE